MPTAIKFRVPGDRLRDSKLESPANSKGARVPTKYENEGLKMSMNELIHFYPDAVDAVAELVVSGLGPIDEIEFCKTVEHFVQLTVDFETCNEVQ